MNFIATATPLTEGVVEKELLELGVKESSIKTGRVEFKTTLENACEIAFKIRTARRILLPLKNFQFDSKEDFFGESKNFEWEEFISPDNTFLVRIKGTNSKLKNTSYTSLLLKDAVVDRIREKKGKRPSISKENPDAVILGYIEENRAQLSLDLGGALHKRGYRSVPTRGTLNETLAAVILKLSGYDGKEFLIDPMAGSGTIGIEAALMSANISPGFLWKMGRGFFSLNLIDEKKKREIVLKAKDEISSPKERIFLSDRDEEAINISRKNAQNAKVLNFIDFSVCDFFNLTPPSKEGLIVTNTPYGEDVSLDEEARFYFKKMGDKLKKEFKNYTASLLLGNKEAIKSIGLRAFKRISLYNGSVEVKLCLYRLYEGSLKEKSQR